MMPSSSRDTLTIFGLLLAILLGTFLGYMARGEETISPYQYLEDCLEKKTCRIARYEYVVTDKNASPSKDFPWLLGQTPVESNHLDCEPFSLPSFEPIPGVPDYSNSPPPTPEETEERLLRYIGSLFDNARVNRERINKAYNEYRERCGLTVSPNAIAPSSD